MNIPELLAPAGNYEKLTIALHYGADAVYMGLSDFSLRAYAGNFTPESLKKAANLVRDRGKKFYITANIFPHNRDIAMIREHLEFLSELSPDALIIADLGVFEMAKELAPNIPIHISTQANITNYRSAQAWEKAGAKRLVLARELSIDEIKEIRDHVSIELECFVHGAICISYSGRCYISSFMANRSGNRGECANSCRWNYVLSEQKRAGEYYPVYENDRGTYILSSRDLCMLEHIDMLAEAGVNSFKIEGRMKGINYLAGVVKLYREAVDSLGQGNFQAREQWKEELSRFSSRGYTTGMFLGRQTDESYNHDEEVAYRMTHELVGVVSSVSDSRIGIDLRNNLKPGDSIEFLSPGLENQSSTVTDIFNEKGTPVESGHNAITVLIPSVKGVRVNDLVRRRLKNQVSASII